MINPNKIVAISFDVDDTLWNFSDSSNQALLETIHVFKKHYAKKHIKVSVEQLQKLRDETEIRLEGIVDDLDDIRRESFRIILSKYGISNSLFLSKLYQTYTSAKKTLTKPYQDVIPAIKLLKSHFQIGIISNGNCYPKDLGIENLIDFKIYSQQLSGIKKPDPVIFRMASKKINCSPKQILHIGDSYENDYIGAKKSGFKSILIDRKNTFPKSKKPNIKLINSLIEIIKTPYYLEGKL